MKYLTGVSTLKIDKEKCTGCGRCLDVCPHTVFVIQERKAQIIGEDSCMECGACALNCAFGALSVKSGVGCATAFFNAMIKGGPPSCDCDGGGESGSCC